jgi:hypothetical protein
VRRDLSAGTHISSLGLHEQKHHEQNCVLNGTAPASVIASQMQGKWPVLAVSGWCVSQFAPMVLLPSLPFVSFLDRSQPGMLDLQTSISR